MTGKIKQHDSVLIYCRTETEACAPQSYLATLAVAKDPEQMYWDEVSQEMVPTCNSSSKAPCFILFYFFTFTNWQPAYVKSTLRRNVNNKSWEQLSSRVGLQWGSRATCQRKWNDIKIVFSHQFLSFWLSLFFHNHMTNLFVIHI